MATEVRIWRILFMIFLVSRAVQMRRHSLLIENDSRKNFALSTFGFLKGGGLMVDILDFSFTDPTEESSSLIGFSLEKTGSDGVSSYMEQHTDKCVLRERDNIANQLEMMLFTLKFDQRKIKIERLGSSFSKIEVNNLKLADKAWSAASLMSYVHNMLNKLQLVRVTDLLDDNGNLKGIATTNGTSRKPLAIEKPTSELPLNKTGDKFSGTITILISNENEGLYNLYFHNCQSKQATKIKMELRIIEHNENTFLSAGDIPLPTIYGMISVLFLISGFVYIIYLKQHRDWTFKIHYLMAAVVLLKSLSLAFHAMNYFYIGKDGRRMESWAVLFYITHLLKGALMFTCIVLIGTGFFFVKQVLSLKEKRIFMIVIPLQILANVASIMIDSTEEGKAQYKTWNQIFILVDLICCGTVLFPVVWSIRHLQEAAKTDGKAAISLAKLKLFRHFYVMIVCYIYFTRIIVYLIKITVPFRYIWLDALCTELASLVFFIMTGYKFRPAPTNPYLHVPEEDIPDIEMNEIPSQSGLTDGLTRVNVKGRKSEDSFTT